jgi:hypothetical protein
MFLIALQLCCCSSTPVAEWQSIAIKKARNISVLSESSADNQSISNRARLISYFAQIETRQKERRLLA